MSNLDLDVRILDEPSADGRVMTVTICGRAITLNEAASVRVRADLNLYRDQAALTAAYFRGFLRASALSKNGSASTVSAPAPTAEAERRETTEPL